MLPIRIVPEDNPHQDGTGSILQAPGRYASAWDYASGYGLAHERLDPLQASMLLADGAARRIGYDVLHIPGIGRVEISTVFLPYPELCPYGEMDALYETLIDYGESPYTRRYHRRAAALYGHGQYLVALHIMLSRCMLPAVPVPAAGRTEPATA